MASMAVWVKRNSKVRDGVIAGLLVKPDMPIFRVNLDAKPKNKELPYWGNYLNVPPLTF